MLTSGVYASTSTLFGDANHDDAVEFRFSFLSFLPLFLSFFLYFLLRISFFCCIPLFLYFSYFSLELQFIFVQMCVVYLN